MNAVDQESRDRTLTVDALCTILAKSKTAPQRLSDMAEMYTADGIDPLACKCLRCSCEWDDVLLRDYRTMSCSNCYSDRVIITAVRLSFNNWGEQNGGEAEQRKRYEVAKRVCSPAFELMERLRQPL